MVESTVSQPSTEKLLTDELHIAHSGSIPTREAFSGDGTSGHLSNELAQRGLT
jgi:hypothetical protein